MTQVRISKRAFREIERVERWWRANREKAPALFRQELDHALDLLASTPHVGIRQESRRHSELRRLVLRKTRYHLYFSVVDGGAYVYVLACWHAERGKEPRLG